jgi:hypothetical protein
MQTAVATLQRAARQLNISGGLDRSKCRRVIAQLREVTDELTAFERRGGKQKAEPVNFTQMLLDGLAAASPSAGSDRNSVAVSGAEDTMVEGPANDLRDLLSSLFEYAGRGPVEMCAQVKPMSHGLGAGYATELTIQSPDIPDFLRRKLWDAVRVRRGEVCVSSEPERCRIKFTLPVERRSATAG